MSSCGGGATGPSGDGGHVGDAADAEVPDSGDGSDAGLAANCRAIYFRFEEIVATFDRSCDTVSDCTNLGGEPTWLYCEGFPALGSRTGGTPVNAASATSSPFSAELQMITSAWDANCAGKREACGNGQGVPCVADAAQYPTSCVNHVCTAQVGYCNQAPPDAGP